MDNTVDRLTIYAPDGYESINPIDLVLDEYSDINLERLLDKLGKYEDMEEQGLLLRLPCKIGDKYYEITDRFNCTVSCIGDCDTCSHKTDIYERWFNSKTQIVRLLEYKRFGKTVFLTKEEAEQALAEMKGE